MSYRRRSRYAEGETLIACSICGFPYLFPSELTYADDKLFYCNRTCWLGKTKAQDERERAASKGRKDDDNPPLRGPKPSWRP